MRAALYRDFAAPLSLETVPDPEPPRDGVVIEVAANGVCRSDWHVQIGLLLAEERNTALPMDLVIARELELRRSHGMPAHHYGALFEQIGAGRFEPGRLVTRRIALEEAGDELAAMGSFGQRGVTVIDRF